MEVDTSLADLVNSSLQIHDKKRRLTGMLKNSPSSEDLIEENDGSSPEKLRRSTRKKFRPLETEKRRNFIKPQKLVDTTNLTAIHNYYLDKKIKRLPPTLETIFEEPQEKKNDVQLMSTRKFKRCISFGDTSNMNKLKSRKRIMKARKVTSKQRRGNKKISIDFLMEKLHHLSDSDNDMESKNCTQIVVND